MVVQLSILVGNVTDIIGLGYTRIEVYQSVDKGNTYQEITASSAAAATISSTPALTTFQMGGKLLKMKIDGAAELSILFSSLITNWTPSQVAARINEVAPGIASVVSQAVKLTSTTTGRASTIEITYNDAYDLGIDSGTFVAGKAARIPFVGGTYVYTFNDPSGRDDDRYKWLFSANGSNPISDFSAVVKGSLAPLLSTGSLSIGTARFYDAMGLPRKTKIYIGVASAPQALSSVFVGGEQSIEVSSDDTGFMQFTLVRGSKVRVGIIGTSYVREFIVPDTATFDLQTVMATATDPFTVQTTPALLIRRSI